MADTITQMLGSWSSHVLPIALGGMLVPSLGGMLVSSLTEGLHGSYLLLAVLSASTLLLTTNLFGPLRYANTSYPGSLRTFRATLPDWAPTATAVALVTLPWSRTWILAALPFTWLYTREYHREAAANICVSADASYARATSAAQRAEEEQRSARSLEERGFEIAAAAGRDSRLARRLRVPDFYGHAANAWSAVHSVSVAAEQAAQHAESVDDAVKSARGSGISSNFDLVNLHRQVSIVNSGATDLKRRAKETEDRVVDFQGAKQYADDYRKREDKTAEKSFEIAKGISAASRDASTASRSAAKLVVDTLRYVAAAKMASSKGKIEEAQVKANNADEAANQAEEQLKKAETARDKVQRLMEALVAGQGP